MAAALSLPLLGAAPAAANGGIAMAVDIQNSQQTVRGTRGGSCTWEVLSDVVVVNLTSETLTVTDITYSVSFITPRRSGVQTNVAVLNNGGLVPGTTFAPDERRTFSPVVVQFDIPCDSDLGDLSVRVTTPRGMGSGDALFLADGTAVPPAAVGGVALALLLATSFFVRHRRGRLARDPAPARTF